METIVIVAFILAALALIVVLVAIVLSLLEEKRTSELKAKRYEELYHDMMDIIDKPLY